MQRFYSDESVQVRAESPDIKELSRALQDQLFNQHKFEKLTLFVMLAHFLLNVQIIELLVAVQSCREIKLATFVGQRYSETNTFPIGKSLNAFDSSYECVTVASNAFVFSLLYGGFWILAVPMYALWKAWRLYLIEFFGMVNKVLLVVVAKVLMRQNATQGVFVSLVIVSIQLIVFLVLCNRQTLSTTEMLAKLNILNKVDLSMYVTVEATCVIGMIDYVIDPVPSGALQEILLVLILLINCIHLLVWAFVSTMMLIRYVYQSPKLALLILCCSCGCIVDKTLE